MTRYCTVCGNWIPPEKLGKSIRVKYCSDVCRMGDRDERKREKAEMRKAKGQCVTCGRKLVRTSQEGAFPRVETVFSN